MGYDLKVSIGYKVLSGLKYSVLFLESQFDVVILN